MNKKMRKFFDSLSEEVQQELQEKAVHAILRGYTIQSESGGCRPDPNDTVMHSAQSDGVTLTDQEIAYLAEKVKDEFK